MFRTRDFLLLFVTIVFLLVAIGATIFSREKADVTATGLQLADGTDSASGAEILQPETLSRAERLAAMREKIAADSGSIMAAPEDIVTEEEVATIGPLTTPSTTVQDPTRGLMLCPGYTTYAGAWPQSGIQIEIIEGARLVYTEVAAVAPPQSPASSTSASLAPSVERNVLLQLPIRLGASGAASCVVTDVVGVAKDGSLIRNTEAGLYGVFAADTLIGYALDGFPIYGVGTAPTDACGGTVVAGQYRYYLSAERDTVLNCFSASPAAL